MRMLINMTSKSRGTELLHYWKYPGHGKIDFTEIRVWADQPDWLYVENSDGMSIGYPLTYEYGLDTVIRLVEPLPGVDKIMAYLLTMKLRLRA